VPTLVRMASMIRWAFSPSSRLGATTEADMAGDLSCTASQTPPGLRAFQG
jgi:hypothetical protein